MNALEVKELTKIYPEFTLDKVSFCVQQGHISGLIGRNGAGKSTTIKGVLRLISAEGSASVFGKDFCKDEIMVKQMIGYVGGGFRYYPMNTLTSIDGIEVDMLYDKDKGYYTTGDVDFGKTVYANVELADAEWKVIMDTGVATYKVYDSKGAEITVVNGVFTLGASDTVTLVFTPVGGGGVDACVIQQKK